MPERSFGEETTTGDLLERDIGTDDHGEAGVSNLKARHAVGSTYSSSSRNSGPEARSVARQRGRR